MATIVSWLLCICFFFFNDTATTEIYTYRHTLSLHDALPIYAVHPINITKNEQFAPDYLKISPNNKIPAIVDADGPGGQPLSLFERSEEHTSELQSLMRNSYAVFCLKQKK